MGLTVLLTSQTCSMLHKCEPNLEPSISLLSNFKSKALLIY